MNNVASVGSFLRIVVVGLLVATFAAAAAAQTPDYTRWVNPFIGTGGHGHTFPGATVPFGMVQLSPDTRIDNWDGSSGYHYSDNIVYGFSHTHLSGTGIPDGCDILIMPTVGEPQFFAKEGDRSVNGYASKFSHANEKTEPGYYSVRLDDDGILAELTSTTRVGIHRYSFPTTDHANIILDLKWRDKVLDSDLKIVGKSRIEGYRRSSSWAKNQVIYFAAEFSKPFEDRNIIESDGPSGNLFILDKEYSSLHASAGRGIKASFRFKTVPNEQILLKVAISYVSIEGARKNLEAELPHWDFDKVHADAKTAWNKELSTIEVSGGTDEQTTNFYTALYHTMIHPNVFNDVDGRYMGHDRKTHQLPRIMGPDPNASPSHYTVFSLWDTFRATHPLYTIIDQRRTVDYINSFIRIYEQGGRLPVWELWGEETDTMIGYHAVSVIADAMAKGIEGFDYEKAYRAAKHSAELDHFGLAGYKKRGYISMEDENESVSRTLEYAYNDWCIAQMALILHKTDDTFYYQKEAERYFRRARYFENLFDTKIGFFRPKKNGGFVEPFAPNEVTFGFTEGNSWQYSFFVPHDVTRLMELMGGREKFIAKVDELLTTAQKLAGREQADLTGLIGQYAHGNEPSHHITYLYNYAGEPWKTQKYVRYIMDNFYKNAPDGLIGNEDCGQMSAWYVMSAGGYYPVAPGSPVYAFGTPLFPEMTYRLENGKSFTIRAKNISPRNIYISEAKLNGADYKRSFITHEDITSGGVLEFTMSAEPSKTAFVEFPVSSIKADTVAVPVITAERTFAESTSVSLSTLTPDSTIRYTIDGTAPTNNSPVYSEPFKIDRTATIRAIAYGPNGTASFPVESKLAKRPHDWTVKVISGYSTQYTGGGENAIVDGIRGTVNFASGEWQGVQGKAYEAMIDLKRETEIKELGGSFLQVAGPWIWMPDRIEFELSSDGVNFTRAAEIKPRFPQREMTPTVKEFRAPISPTIARFVRVRAFNIGKIPAWHPGAGGDPWIFVDELIIE
ncbi:MAG: GH92 family glycosyl hydrolase [Pyrinomonadaceae bacterium]|nr:GH92 family glycosyl hydrolase [Pyrinomonadaceae bacterium]